MIEAISGVDIALWDLIGKALRQPIHRLLGCYTSAPLPVYASSVFFKGKEAMVREAEDLISSGFSAIKLKIGMGPEQDLENVRSLRKALGDEVKLMVDVNCGYDRSTALKVGRELQEQQVYWFEEPLPPEDLEAMQCLARPWICPLPPVNPNSRATDSAS